MSKNNGMTRYNDYVSEGFHVLDDDLIVERPPKIVWEPDFLAKDAEYRADYCARLANTMNHAAYLIQNERDNLNTLLQNKEKQLESMSHAIAQNNSMLQQEVTRMNEQRQSYHVNIQNLNLKIRKLNARIKELTGGDDG